MKILLVLAIIVIAAAVLATPILEDREAQAERARAARIAEETRLEQARAATVTAQADAFGLKATALLPWAVLILGGVFVGSLIVVLALRPPSQQTIDAISQLPPQIGHRPVYFVQGPHESPEAFMTRVAMQMRQIDLPERYRS